MRIARKIKVELFTCSESGNVGLSVSVVDV
jgi:hypothetical protein